MLKLKNMLKQIYMVLNLSTETVMKIFHQENQDEPRPRRRDAALHATAILRWK